MVSFGWLMKCIFLFGYTIVRSMAQIKSSFTCVRIRAALIEWPAARFVRRMYSRLRRWRSFKPRIWASRGVVEKRCHRLPLEHHTTIRGRQDVSRSCSSTGALEKPGLFDNIHVQTKNPFPHGTWERITKVFILGLPPPFREEVLFVWPGKGGYSGFDNELRSRYRYSCGTAPDLDRSSPIVPLASGLQGTFTTAVFSCEDTIA